MFTMKTAWHAGCIGLTVAAILSGCGVQPSSGNNEYANLVPIASTAQFDQEVLQADVPCVVDFYADWCGPCRKLKPVLNELAGEWQGKIKFVAVDVDEHKELARKYGIRPIPDVRFFAGGELVGGAVGFRDKRYWEGELRKLAAGTP